METRVITAHVPTLMAEQVDSLAARYDRSRGWIVKQALSNWIDIEEKHHRMTLEGMADVDAGRVIDDEDLDAWLDSLDINTSLPRSLPEK